MMRLLFLILFAAVPLEAASNIEGRVVVRGARDSGNAVVYIDAIPGKRFTPPVVPIVLDQINLTFVPHVLAVLAGTKVAFPNSDEVRHNVFSPGPVKFNLGTYARNTTLYRTFDKSGVVTLLCNVHAEMSAYVIVTDTPYFAVTDRQGRFTLKDVPPGKYVLKVWHEPSRTASIEMMVGEGAAVILPPIELKR